jgi:hypothetical protein
MMTCDEAQQRLLDEAAPRSADLEAHLAGCPACQDFAHAQAAALRLLGAVAAPARRPPLERVRQRAAALGALALVVGGASGWWSLQGRDAHPVAALERAPEAGRALALERAPLRLEVAERAAAAPPAVAARLEVAAHEAASFEALAALTRQVHASARVNPQVHDASYRPFGALPTWLALKTTPPIRSLGGAVSPLVYSLEE